jgi:hypothetical protein
MNLQTMENRTSKMADSKASRLIFYSARTALNGCFANMAGENYLPITALSSPDWKTCGHSRVKAAAKHNNHAIPSVSIERGAERGGNMGYIDAGFTADAPQGEL